MSKCVKVKNPCKICLNPVTQKNGLQCQGICASWVHFNCIHYTPGKIRDIKAGLLKINCPCPDCKTDEGKEYYMNAGFTCEKTACPARFPPICGNTNCVEAPKKTAIGTKYSDPCIIDSLHRRSSMESTVGDSVRACASNSDLASDIDQVCLTVAQLTQQINNLMYKLKDALNSQNLGTSSCHQDGPRSLCPKPCFCAENPTKGKKRGK